MESKEKDPVQAKLYAERALKAAQTRAEQGDAYYQMLLGALYQYGLNGLLPVDRAMALEWTRKACFQHYGPAYLALHELIPLQNEENATVPLDTGHRERARLFLQKHPEIKGGDGRTEQTAYDIQKRWPEVTELHRRLDQRSLPRYHARREHALRAGKQEIVEGKPLHARGSEYRRLFRLSRGTPVQITDGFSLASPVPSLNPRQ